MTDLPEKLDLTSHNLPADKTAELLRLFPEIRTEGGQIDFDRLKLVLGETIDVGKERYGMTWPGKADCFKTIQAPSTGTLVPALDESVDFDTTENLIIEGDNLEVLKLLQKAYLGKVKMIYIDPPYNTGNDFIYPDNYAESLQTYLEYTGQVDAEGKKFGTNNDTDGRFHSRWLNMMYPRLYLARNLLSDDGVLFISIDDRELDNLKKLCNEIFGEESYKGTVVRATGQTTGQDSGGLGSSFDYVLVYFKNPDLELSGLPLSESDLERYEEEDDKGKYALWQLRKTGSNDRRTDRPNMYFAIKDPEGNEIWPIGPTGYESCWRFDKKGYERLVADNYIVWKKRQKNEREEWWPYVKTYLEGRTKRPSPLWTDIEGSKKASIDLREIMGESIFDNPKPLGLLVKLFQIAPDQNSEGIVLDFFAGSGTTGHAVIELNKQNNSNYKYILVQLPEPIEKEKYSTIAEITKERVRRVIKKLNDKDAGQLPSINSKQDRGFRVFKLSESNFMSWDASAPKDGKILEQQLVLHIDHIREGRTGEDILYEILLKSGFPLTTPVEKIEIEGKSVYSVAAGGMLICMEKDLTLEVIRAMAENKPQRVVCLDMGFAGNDQLKANAVQIFKTKEVVFKTV
ncbi:MAG: site-specific DNA-methyltransferase [Anaerolineales bacterium]|nr:site-specific DNA-methyltransferase [Anaerolineales bacterium]